MEQRHQELKTIWRNYADFYRVSGSLFLIFIGIFIGWLVFSDHDGYGMNLWTELIGVGFTFMVLDWWTRKRDERQSEQREKERLIKQIQSSIHTEAIRAVEGIRDHGWYDEGIFTEKQLMDIHLQNAKLDHFDLHGLRIIGGDMQQARLDSCNCQGSIFFHVDLTAASLVDVDFRGATLSHCDLYGADISGVDFRGANLTESNLSETHARTKLADRDLSIPDKLVWIPKSSNPLFNETTILPDGTNWSTETDMRRFTDPAYQQFWRSSTPFSYAHLSWDEEKNRS